MSELITLDLISRRRALSLMGWAAVLGLAAPAAVLTTSHAAAQTPATPAPATPTPATPAPTTGTPGMERRKERRTGRDERRNERRTGRTERREERRN